MSELTLYRGEVFDFIDSPLNRKDAYRYFPDGALVVREGEIVDCGPFEEIKGRYTDYELVDYSGKLLMPGFIDSHIHYPQAEIIGMYGRQLLDWLEDYTFPAEQAFVSSEHADRMAHFFVEELFRNGTTACMAYATVHPTSVTALFSVASEYNMCMLTGKVLMDRNAPAGLTDTAEQGEIRKSFFDRILAWKRAEPLCHHAPFCHFLFDGTTDCGWTFARTISWHLYTDASFRE